MVLHKCSSHRGGFLEQLEEVLIKDREASKTLRKETTAVKVRLRNLRTYSSKLVADCIVIATESLEFKDLPPSNKLGIVLSNSTVQKWCIHQDIVLHIIPPWLVFCINGHLFIMSCTLTIHHIAFLIPGRRYMSRNWTSGFSSVQLLLM